MARKTGEVKWFDDMKGFGFIKSSTPQDVFVHCQEINMDSYATLKQGQKVSFDLVEADKGPTAKEVEIIEDKSKEKKSQSNKIQEEDIVITPRVSNPKHKIPRKLGKVDNISGLLLAKVKFFDPFVNKFNEEMVARQYNPENLKKVNKNG